MSSGVILETGGLGRTWERGNCADRALSIDRPCLWSDLREAQGPYVIAVVFAQGKGNSKTKPTALLPHLLPYYNLGTVAAWRPHPLDNISHFVRKDEIGFV